MDSVLQSWASDEVIRGQSFTVGSGETALDSIGFFYRDSNHFLGAPTITMDLFLGAGYGGTLIDTVVKTATIGTGNHWEDFDFSSHTLLESQVYTFRITAGPAAGGYGYRGTDHYAGGTLYDELGSSISDHDMTFRVLGSSPGAIPEPSSIASACLGLLALARCRRCLL